MRFIRGELILFVVFILSQGCAEKKECSYEIKGKGKTLRLFVMGHKQLIGDAISYKSYTQSYLKDVDNVKNCLSSEKINLFVFPENAGLLAAFIGEKGEEARKSQDSLSAFASLFSSYSEELNYYMNKYQDLPIGRYLTLALTHTIWKAFFTTFSKIAKDYNSYVVSCVNVAEIVETDSPELLSLFGDRSDRSVYVAKTTDVYNMAVIFGPDGKIIDKVKKVYLVPEERDLLALTHNSLEDFSTVSLPFGKVGIVISKDAWMPDVLDRLNIRGARLILQPEAFDGWGYDEYEGWNPDVFKESSWNHTQKYPLFTYSAVPMLVGNLFDLSFDGQTHISKISEPEDTPLGFVGQEPSTGFLAIADWVMEDPGDLNPSLTIEERRETLNERVLELAPGSGSPFENLYVPKIIIADLDLEHLEGVTGEEQFPSVSITSYFQRFPSAATVYYQNNLTVYAVWSEIKDNQEVVNFAKGTTDSFSQFLQLTKEGEQGFYPSIKVLENGDVAVVWEGEEGNSEDSDVFFAISKDGGNTFQRKEIIDSSVRTYNQWQPSMDVKGDKIAIAWVDWRNGREDIYFTMSEDGGLTFNPDIPVEKTKTTRPDQQDNSFRPSVAISTDGTVLVAWTDFRNYSWDIYASVLTSGVSSFSSPFRVDDAGYFKERLHSDPDVEYHPDGYFLVAWTDLRNRNPYTSIRITRVYPNGTTEGKSHKISSTIPAWIPEIAVSPEGVTVVVFQGLVDGTIRSCYVESLKGNFSEPECIDKYIYSYTPYPLILKEDKNLLNFMLFFQGIIKSKGRIGFENITIQK